MRLSLLERSDGSVTDPVADTLRELIWTYFPASEPVKRVTYSAANNTDMSVIRRLYSKWIIGKRIRRDLED